MRKIAVNNLRKIATFFVDLKFEVAISETRYCLLKSEFPSLFILIVFQKYFVVVLVFGIGFKKNVGFIKCMEIDPTKGVGFDYRLEFGHIELLVVEGKSLSTEINQNFAKGELLILFFELGDIDIVGPRHFFLVLDNEPSANFRADRLHRFFLVVVNTHE